MNCLSRMVLALLITCLSSFLIGTAANAQDDAEYFVGKSTGRVVFIKPKPVAVISKLSLQTAAAPVAAADPISASDEFLSKHGPGDLSKDLWPWTMHEDNLGMKHVAYSQIYNGVPVLGGDVRVHLGADNQVTSVNGSVVSDIELSTVPKLTTEEAEELARAAYAKQFETERPVLEGVQLVIINTGVLSGNAPTESRLAWEVQLVNLPRPIVDELFYIDAENGEVLYQLSNVRQLFRRMYDCSVYNMSPLGPACYVGATIDGYPDRKFGRRETEAPVGPNPLRWGSTDVDYAWDLTGHMYNWYLYTFGRDGGNKHGGLGDGSTPLDPLAGTHIFMHAEAAGGGDCLGGAIWYYKQVQTCTGFVTVDILGHEYSHSVGYYRWADDAPYTSPKNSLVYSGQSGALEENWADIGGEMIERYITGSNDWKIGTDFYYGVIRDMANPSSQRDSEHYQPDKFNHPWVQCAPADNYGVHSNANIPNHAAYLTAMGGGISMDAGSPGLARTRWRRYFIVRLMFTTRRRRRLTGRIII